MAIWQFSQNETKYTFTDPVKKKLKTLRKIIRLQFVSIKVVEGLVGHYKYSLTSSKRIGNQSQGKFK